MAIDTTTPAGRLPINLVGSIAQFEREIMLACQREGIAKAKAENKFKGRQPTARRNTASVMARYREGRKPGDIAGELDIGRSSAYRILVTAGALSGDAS